jgi:hypothetical protein
MREPLVSTKVTPETLRLLRILAAMAGKRQYETLESIVKSAAKKKKI